MKIKLGHIVKRTFKITGWLFLILFIGLLLFIGSIIWAYKYGDKMTQAEREERLEERYNVDFTKNLLNFSIGEEHFSIPQWYVEEIAGRKEDGEPNTVSLRILLPDFKGRDESTKEALFKTVGFGDKLYVYIKKRDSHKKTSDYATELFSSMKEGHENDIVKQQYDQIIYGLELYSNYYRQNEEYYSYRVNNEITLIMRCSKIEPDVSPPCKGWWDSSEDVAVRFTFHRKYLPHWKEIRDNINHILRNEPVKPLEITDNTKGN